MRYDGAPSDRGAFYRPQCPCQQGFRGSPRNGRTRRLRLPLAAPLNRA
jgi:hypothetical protein